MTASTTLRRLTAALAAAALAVAAFAGCTGAPSSSEQSGGDAQTSQIQRVSSHDPSIVKDGDTYYIFGSHRAWAKSTDLVNWKTFENNLSTDYETILGGIWEEWSKQSTNPDVEGNMWAPDVFWNETMGKWCMYLSVNGDNYRSVIVLLTADDIEGDWTYVGPVVYSGFTKVNVGRTDVEQVLGEDADLTRYQSQSDTGINAIDPTVKTDEDGTMWMVYGSWFGGVWMFKLDPTTGLRDYTATYETVENQSDAYYGIKVAGGFGNSGEGAYLAHANGHWYLFLSYGHLQQTGGYQVRVFRSDSITGPYVDQAGNTAIATRAERQRQRRHRGLPGP